MKRMKKAVLNKAEGRMAHKFQFELTLTKVGALDRVLKGLDGSTLFVQERPSKSNTYCHSLHDTRLRPSRRTGASSMAHGGSLQHLAALSTYDYTLFVKALRLWQQW